ncbi:unnamed protein product, partial [Prorocentrum cordatum]
AGSQAHIHVLRADAAGRIETPGRDHLYPAVGHVHSLHRISSCSRSSSPAGHAAGHVGIHCQERQSEGPRRRARAAAAARRCRAHP